MAYGIEVFNSSGVKVLELSNRVARFVQSGTGTLSSFSSVNVTVTGMQNNDSWDVFLYSDNAGFTNLSYTKNNGYFTINNPAAINYTYFYWVVRS